MVINTSLTRKDFERMAEHLVKQYKCECNCSLSESNNQPCICDWGYWLLFFKDLEPPIDLYEIEEKGK
ncbi:MAG: hypothetical protein K9H48_07660 [Melioribacteraceae bacterium]|nr:hypothetical protein [Melioribacteraceae bacterium]